MKPVQVTPGKHPFEVAVLVAALLVGVVLLFSDSRPKTVTTAMPDLVQGAWVVLLIVAGAVGLVGVLWRGAVAAALSIEAVGVVLLGSATTMYTIALLAVNGINAAAAGGFTFAVATGAWWRLAQIRRDLRRIDRAVEASTVADVPLLMERNGDE